MAKATNAKTQNKVILVLGWLVVTCIAIAGIEVVSYVFLSKYASTRLYSLVYQPPTLPSRKEYEEYLETRHPALGWPRIDDDGSGSPHPRKIPSFATSDNECVTAYGDSFVFGDDVSDGEAWSNYLSQRLGCPVGNYGVSAYGTGQAVLRFQINERDAAPVTYLGIWPSNYKRILNQHRIFLVGKTEAGFKPRYYLSDGKPKLAELPVVSYDDLAAFFENPADFLSYEEFLPDSTLGPVRIRFPYSLRVIRIALKDEVRNWIAGRPDWSSIIQPGHRSNSFELTVAIVSRFVELCADRKKRCFVVLFPARNEYDYFRQSGVRVVQSLLDEFDRRSIPYLDLTRSFHETLGGGSICAYFGDPNACEQGHFNAAGNRIVSDILYEYLSDQSDLDGADGQPEFKK